MSYPGGKESAGVWRRIINQMPPHDVYVEPFVGGGAILLRKKPAARSIVCDLDADVAAGWSTIAESGGVGSLTAIHGDARSIIAGLDGVNERWLFYCDPPYVLSARRSSRPIYRHEMTDGDHRALLAMLLELPARVMLSGYRNPIYREMLAGWRRVDYRVRTRRATVTESLWMNFDQPRRLGEYVYLGDDYRERERIKKKKLRWRARLERLPMLERAAIMEVLRDLAPPEAAVLEHRREWRGCRRAAALAEHDGAAGSPSMAVSS